MSLDAAKLEKVRELPGGIVQARCPACAEGGHDRTGEHLRIYPDGRFGCCVHPKDKEHRKRIFALAGGKLPSSGSFTVRLKAPSAAPLTRSVKAALVMPRQPSPSLRPPSPIATGEGFGTLGTGNSELRARARVDSTAHIDIGEDFQEKLKDSKIAVPSVPVAKSPLTILPKECQPGMNQPYLAADGTLVIPFDSPDRYHWWRGGQSIALTRAELNNKQTRKENHAVTI